MNQFASKVLSLVLLFALCGFADVAAAMSSPQEAINHDQQSEQQSTETQTVQTNKPDSQKPGDALQTEAGQNLPDSPGAAQSGTQDQSKSQNAGQPLQEPRGTAAAEAAKTHGGAASKPAGAAIAPAKQRRTRSLLIKLGIIAGAGAALGTVYGLSKGSPSRPPGAR
jgi:hypothetical protein